MFQRNDGTGWQEADIRKVIIIISNNYTDVGMALKAMFDLGELRCMFASYRFID